MQKRVLLGMLTPSSNTILEPVTSAMIAPLSNVSAHFSRFPVTEISLAADALNQFDFGPMLDAAALLADARVDVICWNGTSASWLGLERDRALCAEITARTGVPATSSVLALDEILRRTGVTDYGLVTPYLDEIQDKIIANFESEGFRCQAERHLNDRGNFSFAEFSATTIEGIAREVAAARPQAIAIVCTNFNGAPLVERLEQDTGIPIYDSVATAVWSSLRIAGVDPALVTGWGRLFHDAA